MNRFIVLYHPLVPISHRDRIVSPVHHPCVQHDREQTAPFEYFRQDHGRPGPVDPERKADHDGPLCDALAHCRHVVSPTPVVRVAGKGCVFGAAGQKLFKRNLTRLTGRGEHHGHKVIGSGRPSTGIDGLLLLPSSENSYF